MARDRSPSSQRGRPRPDGSGHGGIVFAKLDFASPTERNTNKGIKAMGFLNLNADRKVHTPIHCRMCGSTIERGIPRPLESICLICRAAILDRMFRTRERGPLRFRPSVR